MAVLSAARNHRRPVLAGNLYDRMKLLFPNQPKDLISASILLSNTYSSVGEDQQAKQVRLHRLKHYGRKVQVGVTLTEVHGKIWVRSVLQARFSVSADRLLCVVQEFQAHDDSHPQVAEIRAKLAEMLLRLIEYGYKADSSWITRELRDDETPESVLCGHSEKLAIAFNLIQQPSPSVIQLTKNLRICGDCRKSRNISSALSILIIVLHTCLFPLDNATKLLAKIYKCDIFARDANRIHHFQQNGQCSCLDHF